jgi:6-phosphogluconolactonase
MPTGPVVRVLTDPAAVFTAAATEFLQRARTAIQGSGRFTVALSGGSTPRRLYTLLATQADVPWDNIYLFFSDERHVPPDHPDSNYRMANEALFSQAPIPKENIFRVPAEIPDADTAAQSYEQTLRQFFQLDSKENDEDDDTLPRFDLVLLGLGPDGHTASLFPGTAALHEDDRLVAANWVEKFKTWRITFTYPVLNHAAAVLFMATGEEKQEALLQVLQGKPDPETYPAQGVHPGNGSLIWLVDQAAAGPMK